VRLKRAGVPVEHRAARTKPKIALAEIDRVIAAGVRFGCVLADAGYGLSAPFRQGLTARGLAWAVGIATLTGDLRSLQPPRAVAVKDAQPPKAARSVLDGHEHDGVVAADGRQR
jgi:SRSO17 transposase